MQHQANMTTENEKMLELLQTMTEKVSALEKADGGSSGGGGNRKSTTNVWNGGGGIMAWRRVPPKEGETDEKIVSGKKYKHCCTCRQGKGL